MRTTCFELPAAAVIEETASESDVPVVDFEPETDMPFDDAPPVSED